jgi:hypothetical protein
VFKFDASGCVASVGDGDDEREDSEIVGDEM